MNSKMLLAFVGGLIVASGVTYIAMKRSSPAPVETAAQANPPASKAAVPATAPDSQPAAEPATETTAPESKPEEPVRKARVKPAPAVRHEPRAGTERAAVQYPQPAPVTPATTPPQAAPTPAPSQPAPAAQNTEAPKSEPAPSYQAPALPPPPPQPHTVTIPVGTLLTVRLGETLSSEKNQAGDQFSAVLDQPLVIDGFVIAERGARAQGRIVELDRSGRVRGVARMALELTSLKTSDGQNIKINTSAFTKQADTTRRKDATKVGGGAALGAIIGAIAGGGKGAAIGAGVGGAAGAGDVALTRGQAAELRVETRISFRLSEAVPITERLQ